MRAEHEVVACLAARGPGRACDDSFFLLQDARRIRPRAGHPAPLVEEQPAENCHSLTYAAHLRAFRPKTNATHPRRCCGRQRRRPERRGSGPGSCRCPNLRLDGSTQVTSTATTSNGRFRPVELGFWVSLPTASSWDRGGTRELRGTSRKFPSKRRRRAETSGRQPFSDPC